MLALGSLAFAAPWLLAALAALPVIWWLLRVTPPAPRRIAFPAIRLLLGLTPREETPARTPWWLILLRTVAGGAGHSRAGASAAQSARRASPETGRWSSSSTTAGRRRATGPAGRPPRPIFSPRPTARTARSILVTTAPLASGEALPPLAPVRASRRPRRGTGAAAEAVAGRPQGGARSAPGDEFPAGHCERVDQRRNRAPSRRRSDRRGNDKAQPTRADRRRSRGVPRRARHAALCRGRRGRCAAPAAARAVAREQSTKEFGVVVQSLPAALPRPVTVRASAEDGALLGARNRDDRTGREPGRAAPADADRAAQPGCPGRDRGRGVRPGRWC